MMAIYKLMDKGGENLSADELKKLVQMSVAVEKYEDEVLGFQAKKIPESIVEMVELKMFENKMTQAKLASAIGMGQSKISDILAGKRKPDIPFLKGVYKAFKIDGNFLLEHL